MLHTKAYSGQTSRNIFFLCCLYFLKKFTLIPDLVGCSSGALTKALDIAPSAILKNDPRSFEHHVLSIKQNCIDLNIDLNKLLHCKYLNFFLFDHEKGLQCCKYFFL